MMIVTTLLLMIIMNLWSQSKLQHASLGSSMRDKKPGLMRLPKPTHCSKTRPRSTWVLRHTLNSTLAQRRCCIHSHLVHVWDSRHETIRDVHAVHHPGGPAPLPLPLLLPAEPHGAARKSSPPRRWRWRAPRPPSHVGHGPLAALLPRSLVL